MDRVSATTAPLDAQYEAKFAMPTSAATEPWLMIDPPPAATISRAAAREHRNVPLALTAKQRSQSSSVASMTEPLLFTPGVVVQHVHPAELAADLVEGAATWSGSRDVGGHRQRPAAVGGDLLPRSPWPPPRPGRRPRPLPPRGRTAWRRPGRSPSRPRSPRPPCRPACLSSASPLILSSQRGSCRRRAPAGGRSCRPSRPEASSATASAISPGWATRPTGIRSSTAARSSGWSSRQLVIGV